MTQNQYIHPTSGLLQSGFTALCNASFLRKVRRRLFSVIPFVRMRSDVKNVVYLNWMVDTDRVGHLVPEGVQLMEKEGKTLLSVLTYEHGHFGPVLLGPLRKLLPGPYQSNWRLYVNSIDNKPGEGIVLFLKNIMDRMIHVAGTRIASDSMLTHYSDVFTHKHENGEIHTQITPSGGSSPDLEARLRSAPDVTLPQSLISHFGNQRAVLEYICLQHAALTDIPDGAGKCKAEIDLPIDLDTVQGLDVDFIDSVWLKDIVAGSEPFAFLVPEVRFEVVNEYTIVAVP